MNFSNNSDYSIISNSEAASVINRFTPDMIMDAVNEVIQDKYRDYSLTLSNIVESIELNYKMAIGGIPEYSVELKTQRHDNYCQVVSLICNAHQLIFSYSDNIDMYSAASIIYDFLISRFNCHLIDFFVNYINREKSTLYDALELAAKRKESSAYSKKLYKNSNSKLATIHANLEFVLANICEYDIDFDKFIELAYLTDKPRAKFLLSVLSDSGDFFKRMVVPYFRIHYAILTTHIKMALQGLSTVELDDLV